MFTVIPNRTYATVKHDDKHIFDVVFSFACTEDQKSEQIRLLFDMVIAANASKITTYETELQKSISKRLLGA